MSYKTVKSYITKNDCYKCNDKLSPKGLMLHSVGCAQPKAKVFIDQFNKSGVEKAVHGFIDASTGTYYNTMPYNMRAWHCGSATGNSKFIGVEMCEPSAIKYTTGSSYTITNKTTAKTQMKRAYETAVELFADLCKKYDFDPMKDIISHKEGHAKGLASNHGDPDHVLKIIDKNMNDFRKDVKAAMKKSSASSTKPTTTKKPDTKKKTTPKKTTKTSSTAKSYQAIINVGKLNIRKGPGVSYGTTGTVSRNEVYTIVDEKNGWGKLKSGAGWINLSYTKKKK